MHSYKSKEVAWVNEKERLISLFYVMVLPTKYSHITLQLIIDFSSFFLTVNFDHFQILRAIGKGSFGKVSSMTTSS